MNTQGANESDDGEERQERLRQTSIGPEYTQYCRCNHWENLADMQFHTLMESVRKGTGQATLRDGVYDSWGAAEMSSEQITHGFVFSRSARK